jgi:hypothetical protein
MTAFPRGYPRGFFGAAAPLEAEKRRMARISSMTLILKEKTDA